jgi:ABC-type glycerol-3-phosphate transport system substrate-binding protein
MIYSFGGDLVEQRDGRWVATINTPEARAALETLKTMRWEDESLTQQQLLEVRDVLPLLATERVAMAIMAGDSLRSLKVQYEADMDRFCLGPLPQAGGDATLAGGAAWMFNPRSSPEVLQAAVEWSLFQTFEAYESDLRAQAARGQLVGWPELPIFVGEYQAIRDEIIARYANAPIENYRPFLEATHIRLKPEPPVEAQQLYRILDVVAQAILTDPFADPEQVLLRAEREFQTRVLDQLP